MARLLGVLFLCVGLALAQEGKDDEGITIDEAPSGPEPEPDKAKPARAPGTKPATVTIREKEYSFAVPEDWVLTRKNDAKAALAWDVLLPGSSRRAGLYLFHHENSDARSAPHRDARLQRAEEPGTKAEVFPGSPPRMVALFQDPDGEWANDNYYVSKGRHLFIVRLACAAADLPGAEADHRALAASFTADLEPWPPIPKGYGITLDGIWRIAAARDVTESLVPLKRVLAEEEKRFRRVHGAIAKADLPLVVLVHNSTRDARAIEPDIDDTEGFYADIWQRRLFAIPLGKDDDRRKSRLAEAAHKVLFLVKYGDIDPGWVWTGESTIARAETELGKPLPSLLEGFADWLSDLKLHRLNELDALEKAQFGVFGKESLFHVAALQGGKYRPAYEAFLQDLARTGDGRGACERHLLSIDPDEMRKATYDYINTKLRSEKKEEKEEKKK